MPRRARICLPGVPLHIVQRGHNRRPCFFAESDFRYYLYLLREQSCRQGCAIHAYVLMTNHIHLLLTPEESDSAAKMMKQVGQRYVQHVKRWYARGGTLWDGRFKSSLAKNENYILTCYRYIELNPVRAGIVSIPGEYPWSSYLANAEGIADPIVTPHEQYLRLGSTGRSRLREYANLLRTGLDEQTLHRIRFAVNGNHVLQLKA